MSVGQAVGGGFDPTDYIGVGIGGALVLFSGRLMMRLWTAWGDYATNVNTRSTDSESRADATIEKLAECMAENGGLRASMTHLEEQVEELRTELSGAQRRAIDLEKALMRSLGFEDGRGETE